MSDRQTIPGRTIGCGWSVPPRPFAFPFIFPEAPMDAHQTYKLIEAAGRLVQAGGEVIKLADGREAIALPVALGHVVTGPRLTQLEREVLERTAP